MNSQEVKECVKAEYGQAALQAKRGGSSCCGSVSERAAPITSNLYEVKETEALPAEAVLASLGCGNPTALGSTQSWRDGPGSRVRWRDRCLAVGPSGWTDR